ncbi:hypothetical protein BDW62DRAFT_96173 [Aspergillus aurantiobrunneus]
MATTSTATRKPLTKRNLAIHDQLLQTQPATEAITSWVENIILEEQTHLFCSQLSASLSDMHLGAGDTDIERDMDRLDQRIRTTPTAATTNRDNLKILERQRPFMYLETPQERFLTPGSSDPSYFSRPAMAHMGIQYGSMEGRKQREDVARGHLEAIRDNALQARDTPGK